MVKNLNILFNARYLEGIFKSRGYAFFTNGDYNLNIVGIRNPNLKANSFDDTLLCAFKENGVWQYKCWSITTDAGTYWLKNPLSENGTAILVPNQYRGVYSIRKHQNKYLALCQTNGNVQTYRDNNKNEILDMNSATITTGNYGINIHRSNPHTESVKVDKWSAGCQVFSDAKDFDEFMAICEKSKEIWGNKFTYTLINEADIL